MAKIVVTAAEVQQAASSGVLQVPAGAIVTPLAKDVAAELGVTITRSGGSAPAAPTVARKPVKLSSIRDARLERFPYPGPPADMEVKTVDVVTADDGAPVATGYMSITKGSFPWTLTYDEVQIVLEGELHLGGDAGGKVGYPGDVFYVPKGSSITFGTPSWAKFVYVTFPANWEDQIG